MQRTQSAENKDYGIAAFSDVGGHPMLRERKAKAEKRHHAMQRGYGQTTASEVLSSDHIGEM